MQELTAQVGIPDRFNGNTWYENAQVCGMVERHKLARFRTPGVTVGRLGNPSLSG